MLVFSKCGRAIGVPLALGAILSGAAAFGQQAAPRAPPLSQRPLSEQLLVLHYPDLFGTTIKVDRGDGTLVDSVTAEGLDQAVRGSLPATILADRSHHDLVVGQTLVWTGFGVAVASFAAMIAAPIALLPGLSSTIPAVQTAANRTVTTVDLVALGVELLSLGVSVVGSVFVSAGMKAEFDAVGAYNRDLVDGRLTVDPLGSSTVAPSR